MFIPKKLQPNFDLGKILEGDNILVNGKMKCCEQYNFKIQYIGEIRSSLLGRKTITCHDSELSLIAECCECRKKIEIFNNQTDGYDNCFNGARPVSEFSPKALECYTCSGEAFIIEITFEYQSKEDLEKDGVNDYQNAFSWIWVNLECSTCKTKYRKIIDYETA